MEQLANTFGGLWNQLVPILQRAVPTFLLVWLLYFYLKKVLFEPLDRVLEERRKRTLGAVEASEATLQQVEDKAAEYERLLNEARAGIYREQEEHRGRLAAGQAQAVEAARQKAAAAVAEARAAIGAEAAQAQAGLAAEAERLAEQIATAVLAGRAA
jgi:F-type H+-transporting ATPase subunit b